MGWQEEWRDEFVSMTVGCPVSDQGRL